MPVKRTFAILAVVWFLALGTGAAEYLHNAQHAREDAQRARRGDDRSSPVHDDTNCPVHSQLHQPLVATPAVPLLICAGLFIAFLSQLPTSIVSIRVPARIDCRGPPVLV